jgi:hypothetical protein
MKDLSNRFADENGAVKPGAGNDAGKSVAPIAPHPDPLARLGIDTPDAETIARESPLRLWLAWLAGRADLLTVLAAAAAVALVLWPRAAPVPLPAVAHTGDEVATLTVRPLSENGAATNPDWYTLFNAYQLETGLRDISIRCNYGLPSDARTDRYIHARLDAGSTIRIFLADPGTCPKL